MRIRAQRKYRPPTYPDRDFVTLNPRLLSRHVPATWVKREFVAGALAMFVAGGCIDSDCSEYDGNISRKVAEARDWMRSKMRRSESAKTVKVAPLFVHGIGSGATGCIAMSPPVFITEEEARKIIESELSTTGVEIFKRDFEEKGACIDRKADVAHYQKNVTGPAFHSYGPKTGLTIDGFDPRKDLSYVYVSREKFRRAWGDPNIIWVRLFSAEKVGV